MSADARRIFGAYVARTIVIIVSRQTTVIVRAAACRIRHRALNTSGSVFEPTIVTCKIYSVACCVCRACIAKIAVNILVGVTCNRVGNLNIANQQKYARHNDSPSQEHVKIPLKKPLKHSSGWRFETTSNEIAGLFNIFTPSNPGLEFFVLCEHVRWGFDAPAQCFCIGLCVLYHNYETPRHKNMNYLWRSKNIKNHRPNGRCI